MTQPEESGEEQRSRADNIPSVSEDVSRGPVLRRRRHKHNLSVCEPLVLILAGGSGTRFGRLGQVMPKPLMTISITQTPLSRLLDQLAVLPRAGVVVSTAPIWSPSLTSFVERYSSTASSCMGSCGPDIRVEVNPAHAAGPVSALDYLVRRHPSRDYLVCLSDIVFVSNPFAQFAGGIFRNSVLAAPLQARRGGVVASTSGIVESVVL